MEESINQLEKITLKEANKIFIKDIKQYAVISSVTPVTGIFGFSMVEGNPSNSSTYIIGSLLTIGSFMIGLGSGITIFNKLEEYSKNPNKYMQKYHDKKIAP